LIPKAFASIDISDINALVTNAAPETRTMDFKLALPGRDDNAKREFLTDVIAFANSGGGDIIYGLDEEDSRAKSATGLGALDVAAEIVRLQQIMEQIQPRIRTNVKEVPGGDTGPLVLLRIEESSRGPHVFEVAKGTYRIFARADGAKYPMSLDEIRASFVRSASIREQVREFRAKRKEFIHGSIPLALRQGPWLLVHVIPFSAFSGGLVIRTEELREASQDLAVLGYSDQRPNIDGCLRWLQQNSGQAERYCQIFRNGCLEFVETDISRAEEKGAWLFGSRVDLAVVRAATRGFVLLRKIRVEPPLLVCLTLANAQGYEMYQGSDDFFVSVRRIDRPMIEPPEIFVDDLEPDIPGLLKPGLDLLWEASGHQRSLSYNEAGVWHRNVWT